MGNQVGGAPAVRREAAMLAFAKSLGTGIKALPDWAGAGFSSAPRAVRPKHYITSGPQV